MSDLQSYITTIYKGIVAFEVHDEGQWCKVEDVEQLEAELQAMTSAARLYKECLDDLKELDPSITVAICGIDDDVYAAIENVNKESSTS